MAWHSANTFDQLHWHLRQREPRVLYFYCHGGIDEKGVPWFKLGSGSDPYFVRETIDRWKLAWPRRRAPLVLLNGCETAAVEPDVAIEFISAFVRDSGAAGVIGTEITIFEELAVDFAETCLRYFLAGDRSLGESVRLTRLALLKKGNPLGLVYIPFAVAGLMLVEHRN